MGDLQEEILKLELSDDIFKGIKFFISGEVHEKIIDLLKCGGAERLNYFSDYVTHLIVGSNPEENDIVDANDVYEIPALTPKWIVMSARLKKLVRPKPYLYTPGGKLFSNLVFCFSNIREDLKYLWSLITYNGGIVQLNLNKRCNFLVASDTNSVKYQKAESLGHEYIKIVTPDWVVETIKHNSLVDATLFHPKLINWPKPVKHESTTAITGFEPEQTEEFDKNEEKSVSDSTQALLEKLKQRMPWNQPSTPKTAPSDPIAPPNVVAPSFIQKGPSHQPPRSHMNQVPAQSLPVTPQSPVAPNFPQIPRSPSSLSSQHIPRSIVHHTPTQPPFQEQQNPLNISRLMGQQQARPNIQQLRGQLGQSQLHQQLLQHRMQQNQQNLIQRSSTGQITVQQQLLQQQLAHRQLLQNQLNQQQRQNANQQSMGPNPQGVGQNQQPIGSNQHLGQLSQQQIAQLQQQQLLKQNQQQQLQQQLQLGPNQPMALNQNQQLLQSQVLQQQNQQQNQMSQQNPINQQQSPINQQQSQIQQQQNQINQQQNQINQQQNQMNQQQNQSNQQQQNQMQQQQQQIQMGQGQNFLQSLNQNQQTLQQKQQFLNQPQTVTSQQQIIHNQSNLAVQQFVSQNFNQNQNTNQEINLQNIQQQPVSQQQQNIGHQLNAQVLNQQLSSQNLGQQLNQQQLNQQLNQQQNQMNQQLVQQNALLNQQLNQQNQMGQPLNQPDQLNQQLNPQSQLNQLNQQQNINQQGIEPGLTQTISQALNQQLNQGLGQHLQQNLQQQQIRQNLQQQQQQEQLNSQQNLNQQMQTQQQQGLNQQQQQIPQISQQLSSPLPQQVVRTQFPQQGNVNQQILINQQSPQTPAPQRAQINQHLWAQQPSQVPGQQIIRHSVNVAQQPGPRVQWSPNAQQTNVVPQRQFIQLDARTHNELQKMPPEQQALFVAKLQRQRQLQLMKQVQQRGQGGSHILIRGNVPPGLTTQQQFQWLQQQAKQQGIILPPNIQQQNITPGTLTQPGLAQNIQHAPGLSPINQNSPQFPDQNQQQQIQLRQYRLQQLQLQREQKNHIPPQQQQAPLQQPTIVRPIGQPQLADSTTNPPPVPEANIQHSLVVNAKTKTALANMLSIKLQSGGSSMGVQRPEALPEPSAAGTLRLMTAQHNAALNSKPQELIALRRTISGPNGEIIKPPGAQPLPITPTNDPPKLQYCPKPALPLQHRPGPFYGHNPNLKLPPDLFLLGCIFVVVELESFLEERLPGWQQTIEKHGGEVEKQYCNRVTHVLCETQRHGVVMQALRDCKRCVTIVWLSDVIARKQVLPPWTALHLPNIYLDTAPASKHLISISGFEGSDRNRVKHMIKYTGAKCTTYFSKHNTLLISTKAEGRKCIYAKKWQIPVVNVQWLTDVMLGNFAAMNQMEHQIYQQFSNPPNFSFDPKLVPNLMLAWKAPINISQESYERVKRSASPVVLPKKPKKQKTEATDENDNISDDHVTNSTHRILFSMFSDTKPLQKMVRDLGGSVAKDHTNFTHLIMPHLARSNKLFFAIAKGVQVLSEQWLKDSHAANQFLPENNYNLNSKDFNYEYKCDIDQTLLTKNRNKLFEGKFFFVTPSVFPSKKLVVELIQSCGGVVERIRRSSAQIDATSVNSPYSYFIVTHENDLHLVADLLKNKKDKMKIVCNVELIFSAILKQTFEVEPYAVCVL